mmetsp:Transcript_45808/g.138869  ORF Transcript_45808/g.138869 Transcript_45808/m.138869 type:complete len:96 (+) Transcript_45808:133-420(+)
MSTGAGRTTTEAPSALASGDGSAILGLPVWTFGALVAFVFIILCVVPLLWWLKRMANLKRTYVPSEAPNVDGFVNDIVGKAEDHGHLHTTRLGRA